MPELEDIRGRTYSWLLRKENPFECRIYEGAEVVGELTRLSRSKLFRANFAGIGWRIERVSAWRRRQYRIGFAGSDLVVAEVFTTRDESFRSWHTLMIDGVEEYVLRPTQDGSTSWRDKAGREPVSLRRLGEWGTAGECDVSRNAALTHAPILLLVGALKAVQGRVFVPSEA